MKIIFCYALLCGIFSSFPNKTICKPFNLLVGARASLSPVLVYSLHYDIYGGIGFTNSNEQFEIRVAYGRSYFNAIWFENIWDGNFWYLDGNLKSQTQDKYSDFLKTSVYKYTRIGFFYILKSDYNKKDLIDPSRGPMQMGFYFGLGLGINRISTEYYYSFGGASIVGTGVAITFSIL